jgi:V-type H+-transporting ATPase subunit G
LRQAKDEAEREIAAYKAEREAEFRRKIEEDSTTSAGNLQRLTEESNAEVKAIQANIAKKKDQVLALLMHDVEAVFDK